MELCKLELTDYGLKQIIQDIKPLKYVDFSGVSTVNSAFLEETQTTKPNLLLKCFKINVTDPKDNGLRCPRRVVEKEGKKKKKGKK
jgi:hypothetical protein